MSAIKNILKSEDTTCTGTTVKQVFAGWANRTSAVHLGNASSANLWFDMVGRGATAPTITATARMGVIEPGASLEITADLACVDLYVLNDTGAATTAAYCARAVDGESGA